MQVSLNELFCLLYVASNLEIHGFKISLSKNHCANNFVGRFKGIHKDCSIGPGRGSYISDIHPLLLNTLFGNLSGSLPWNSMCSRLHSMDFTAALIFLLMMGQLKADPTDYYGKLGSVSQKGVDR